jgi:hypothetical protein
MAAGPSGRPVAVRYATENGTALAKNDYISRSGTVTFRPGQTRATISVPIVNDKVWEGDETFSVRLSNPTNATIGGSGTETFTIQDDDEHGAIRLTSPSYLVSEAGLFVTLRASRVGGSGGIVGASYSTPSGPATAREGVDYYGSFGTLRWEEGDRTDKTFIVPVIEDSRNEGNETFSVFLAGATGGAVLGWPCVATVTIVDNDPLPSVRFSLASSSRAESASPAVIYVDLSSASEKKVTVKYAVRNGTAISGEDYLASSGLLTFSPGQTVREISVPILDDHKAEGDQAFAVTLSSPVNATLGAPARCIHTILDDDSPPVFAGLSLWDTEIVTPLALEESAAAPPAVAAPNDFDGDGRSDLGVFNPTAGLWSLRQSAARDLTFRFGTAGMLPVTGDFDGDGRWDVGVFDPAEGLWRLWRSVEGELAFQFGSFDAVPVTGDFDGDGRTDCGVYEKAAGLWNLRLSSEGDIAEQFGDAGALPVTGDFDGDGRWDRGVFDPVTGLWSLRRSAKGDVTIQLAGIGTVPVTGDFDGDGVTDCGCYNAEDGIWQIALSSGGLRTERLGLPGAIPVIGDYDADGRSDIGCYLPPQSGDDEILSTAVGSWLILRSRDGLREESFGGAGMIPVGGRFR